MKLRSVRLTRTGSAEKNALKAPEPVIIDGKLVGIYFSDPWSRGNGMIFLEG
jgi:hypothetical protein